jgi:AcrR family transcriptional regulator
MPYPTGLFSTGRGFSFPLTNSESRYNILNNVRITDDVWSKEMKTTPRERRQERTRQAIIHSALRLIREKGPNELSLRAVARSIDYSPAGLYEYFDSKEDLIQAVCAGTDDRLRAALESVDPALEIGEYLVELGLAYIRFARQQPEHFIFLFTRLESDTPVEVPHEFETDPHGSFLILYNAIQKAIEAGIFQASEVFGVMEISYSLWSLVHGMAMLQTQNLQGLPIDFERTDREALVRFLRGLKVGSALER